MATDNPALIERLSEIAKTAQNLGRGEKSRYLQTKADELGMSVSTLYRKLESVAVKPTRKARSDKGEMTLTLDDAKLISSVVMEGMRKNGKRIMTVERAVTMLRANGMIQACHTDGTALSVGAIVRGLKAYHLHPDQLLEPAPVVSMKSLHPNHLWQIDPSLCVLYYLPRAGKDTGLRVASHDEFYKNKPANVVKIINDRVWRYTGTDHASGVIYCHYYFGGETSANLCDFFIRMMSPKADIGKDPIRGVPKMVMLDPGSANTSSAFKTLCQALDVMVQINKPNNPRAKGQVEKANDIVETHFESGLKFVEVNDIDTLNALCDKWLRYFNSQAIHSRHGMTRYKAWQKIKSDELIIAPPAEYCKSLALSVLKEAKVTPELEIRYKGKVYDVSALPVLVGQKILVAQNPWEVDGARVCVPTADGVGENWVAVPEVVFDEMGFRENAIIVGQGYKAHNDTKAQTHAKELQKIAMGTDTLEQAQIKRKAKALPFDGKLDPYKHNDTVLDNDNTLYMPKKGVQSVEQSRYERAIAEPVLSKVDIAKQLKPRLEALGADWSLAVKVLQERYPDGIHASGLDEVFSELCEESTFKQILKIA
ncbi:Integrase core domain [Moraxella caprae]|uniref:Integrase core domain n=1 Tax=Moraxella caprae TaxID=90240 RepID=A0A378R2T8_9GAMM|nr:DDE-type integrase/transposase/recombinase [Moraxella caprae]STZ09328.1 Integrase core domain [Moraxella caprae]